MEDSNTESYEKVCSVDDLVEGDAIVREVDGSQIAVFQFEDDVYALENVCPHQGGPLGEGKVEEGCVYCPWHGWQFDVETGKHVQGTESAQTYSLTVEGNDIYITR